MCGTDRRLVLPRPSRQTELFLVFFCTFFFYSCVVRSRYTIIANGTMHMHKQQTCNSKSILEQVQLRAMRSQRLSFLLCKRAATRQTTATKNYEGFPAYKRCVVVARNIWRSGKGTTQYTSHHSKGHPHTLQMPRGQDTVQRTHCNGKWRSYLVSATGITDAGDQTDHTPNTHTHRFICTFVVVRMTMANAQLHNFSTIVTWSGSQPNWWMVVLLLQH